MKRQSRDTWDQKGFTLLEIVVTIVVAALAGLVVFTFVSGIAARSGQPVLAVQALAENRLPLEELAARYGEYLAGDLSWAEFKDLDAVTAGNVALVKVSDQAYENFEVLRVTFTGEQDQEIAVLFSQ